ncbi:hypothetical protein K439DRAFT_1634572 [Ramaria rubella]|nr:hypothetical protein K439DRAFT_1634572 [Ramaria rubella]
MVAPYEILPMLDPDHEQAVDPGEERRCILFNRLKLISSSAFDGPRRIFRAHADALDTVWLTELDRLGPPVFICFMLLRLGLLSLSIFWGFLLVSPFWAMSLVSSEQFLPTAVQVGLVVTLLIIIEAVPFIPLMHDPRSKIYYVLYTAYLLLAWRETCVYLVPGEIIGEFAGRTWVRDICFSIAAASALGCGAMGWTIWEGLSRRLWVLTTVIELLFLQTSYQRYKNGL